jgi:hypothetical protein
MFENQDHSPEPRLRVSETTEEERDVLTVWAEKLVATDSGVQYTQRQQESIRRRKKTEIEAR